jgi:HPt (histidine-containing phosphotransfer) domain-containing protein
MIGEALLVIVPALCGFGASVVTQVLVARKDRMMMALEAKRDQGEHELKLQAQRSQLERSAADLATRYLMTRQRELGMIERIIREGGGDFEQLLYIAHNLKGTGTSYGFPEITRLGAAMEEAGRKRDLAEYTRHYEELATHVRSIPAPTGSIG